MERSSSQERIYISKSPKYAFLYFPGKIFPTSFQLFNMDRGGPRGINVEILNSTTHIWHFWKVHKLGSRLTQVWNLHSKQDRRYRVFDLGRSDRERNQICIYLSWNTRFFISRGELFQRYKKKFSSYWAPPLFSLTPCIMYMYRLSGDHGSFFSALKFWIWPKSFFVFFISRLLVGPV